MPTMNLGDITINYMKKIDKRRKSIGFKMIASDTLIVMIPYSITSVVLEQLIVKEKHWILNQVTKLREHDNNMTSNVIMHGSEILFLGKSRILILIQKEIKVIEIDVQFSNIIVRYPKTIDDNRIVVSAIKSFFIEYSKNVLNEKTNCWKEQIGVKPRRICLKDQKTRWGSCSSLGNINYNWRVVMAPESVIDYLVIHELCHMLEPNHSKKFWQLVEKWCPDYHTHRTWLKTNGHILTKIFN